MSVPGRIGTILIVALALVDVLILASGARRAANAIETHSLDQMTVTHAQTVVQHGRLLSTAVQEIHLLAKPVCEGLTRI